jgi:hypothetical protein
MVTASTTSMLSLRRRRSFLFGRTRIRASPKKRLGSVKTAAHHSTNDARHEKCSRDFFSRKITGFCKLLGRFVDIVSKLWIMADLCALAIKIVNINLYGITLHVVSSREDLCEKQIAEGDLESKQYVINRKFNLQPAEAFLNRKADLKFRRCFKIIYVS